MTMLAMEFLKGLEHDFPMRLCILAPTAVCLPSKTNLVQTANALLAELPAMTGHALGLDPLFQERVFRPAWRKIAAGAFFLYGLELGEPLLPEGIIGLPREP